MTGNNEKETTKTENIFEVRVQKLKKIIDAGLNPYDNTFTPSHTVEQIKSIFGEGKRELPEEGDAKPLDENTYAVAGRVLTLRRFGKAAFFHLMDATGSIQIYIKKDILSENHWNIFKEIDTGDIIGVRGKIFYTKTGELTIMAETLHFITKSLRPLPEKWHGLIDPEIRYRQRYLDLLSNQEVKKIFMARSFIIKCIRNYLDREGFVEVETPILHPLRGGATARPFVTHHNTLDMNLYLRIAPELYLKRLLVGGFGKVYEIGKCFRNEGISTRHNPEFTMLEFYEAFADYKKMLERAEELVKEVERNFNEKFPEFRQKRNYDIQKPWKKMKMLESIIDYGRSLGITREILENPQLCNEWYEKNISPEQKKKGITHGEIIFTMFETIVEPNLGVEPVAIIDFPAEISPLARRSNLDPRWAERFEVYLDGREIINAFSELNDPAIQAENFLAQVKAREGGDEEAMDYDQDYVTALEHGMPPAGGFGLGIDRLVMSLCNLTSIREAILFPTLRPQSTRSDK